MMSLSVEEIIPRLSKINSSSGISDVPDSLRAEHLIRVPDMKARLTILDATFSL
ncbi:MAG: hypothetical protein OQL19_11440 [Gammaproteobacteria bacterium]|nr:hypothetical protein [Gammaproteobacteria bacterium]